MVKNINRSNTEHSALLTKGIEEIVIYSVKRKLTENAADEIDKSYVQNQFRKGG